jgi:hypothetical protein
MKKYSFLLITSLLVARVGYSQFFQGIGVTVGVTKAKQLWFFPKPDSTYDKIKKKNLIGLNASLRAEFINSEWIRWVTEIEYNQKGCKEKLDSAKYKNRINYLSWNNFLKFQFETYPGYFYFLFGPRLEYKLNQKIQSPAIPGKFHTFHLSASAGVGFEKIVFSNFKPFIELHYNPDTPFYYAYETKPMNIRNRAWELKIGIIFRPGSKDDCPGVRN